jgi:hypothetical protein
LATRWVVGGQGCCPSLHHDGGGRAQAGITRGEQCVCVCVRVCVMGGGGHVSRICVRVVCGQSVLLGWCGCLLSVSFRCVGALVVQRRLRRVCVCASPLPSASAAHLFLFSSATRGLQWQVHAPGGRYVFKLQIAGQSIKATHIILQHHAWPRPHQHTVYRHANQAHTHTHVHM